MADFNATFAVNNSCTLLNTGGTSALCACSQLDGNSRHRIDKDRKSRARRTADALCCGSHKNALTKCRRRGRCC